MVLSAVEDDRQNRRHDLSHDGSHRGTGHTHIQHKNEDGVENDIDHCTQSLGKHGIDGFTRRLQQALVGDLEEHTERTDGADGHILGTTLHDLRYIGLYSEESAGEKDAQQGKYDVAACRQKYTVGRCQIGPFKVFLSQTLGQQGVDTNTGTVATAIIRFCTGKARDTALSAFSLSLATKMLSTTLYNAWTSMDTMMGTDIEISSRFTGHTPILFS